MNRKSFWLLGIVCVSLAFGACNSFPTPIKFNENLSVEETTHIFFSYGLEITEYNGIPVEHSRFLGSTNSTWRYVYLPPGEMEFMADVNWKDYDTFYTARDVYFKYKFDAGKTYYIAFTPHGGAIGNDVWGTQYGVNIYEEPTEGVYSSDHEFIAFVRFYQYEK